MYNNPNRAILNVRNLIAYLDQEHGNLTAVNGSLNALNIREIDLLNTGLSSGAILEELIITEKIPVHPSDIDGVNYVSGCEGLTKSIKEYKANSVSGALALLTTFLYQDSLYPEYSTKIIPSLTTV